MTLRRVLLLLASIALGVVLVALLIRVGKIDLRLTLRQLKSVSPLAFAKLVLLNALLVYLSTAKWRSIDKALRRPSDSVPSRVTSFAVSSAGMTLGLFLPVQLGMTAARTLGTYMHGRPIKRGTGGTLLEQGFDVLVFFFLALASGATWYWHGGAAFWTASAFAVILLALLAVEPAIRSLRYIGTFYSSRTERPRNRILLGLWELQQSTLLDTSLGRRLVLLSSIRFGVIVLMAFQTAQAVQAPISLWNMAAAMPFVGVATIIALTPGGVGVNEWTSTSALRIFGTPLTLAAQWSVANRVLATASCFVVAALAAALWAVEPATTPTTRDANTDSEQTN